MHVHASRMTIFIIDFLVGCLAADMAGIIACFILCAAFKLMGDVPDSFWRDLHSMFRLFTFGIYKKMPL